MKVYVNKISGYASAIACMYQSKRSWTRELEEKIYSLERSSTFSDGTISCVSTQDIDIDARKEQFLSELRKVCRIGSKHITLLRFIDVEFTVEGLHRGAQDDFDAHAKRLDNRIVRSSTRLAEFGNEKSDYYADKVLTTDEVLDLAGIEIPDEYYHDGVRYVKTVNGYIRDDLENNKDVKRGLYMLSIPSCFTAKCNITELAHIVKLRDKNSNANPELKEMIEQLLTQIEEKCPLFTRDLFYSIEN